MLQNIEFIGVFCEGAAFGTAPLTSKKDKLQNKEKKATLLLASKGNPFTAYKKCLLYVLCGIQSCRC